MNEATVRSFWEARPCGDQIVGGLEERFHHDYESFFTEYDAWRYLQEGHILGCLDGIDWRDRDVLEIGLGQGADVGANRSAAARAGRGSTSPRSPSIASATRLRIRSLPHVALKRGSAVEIPYDDASFDLVFSHGVLHHIPDIHRAQSEIHRVLRPGGLLVAMLYARRSLNYQVEHPRRTPRRGGGGLPPAAHSDGPRHRDAPGTRRQR